MSKEQTMKKEELPVVQQAGLPAEAQNYAAYAGQGFEGHTNSDYSVPFLAVLQGLSPLVGTNAKARPGMLVNTVTEELYDGAEGVVFVPSATQHVFVEWVPRDQGGGFVKMYELNDPIVLKAQSEQEFGKYKMVKGDAKSNDLIETYYVYGMFVDKEGMFQQMIIAFTSTKNKSYKDWMTMARTVQIKLDNGQIIRQPALFCHRYRIRTYGDSNDKGKFYNLKITWDGEDAKSARLATNDDLFCAARDFNEQFKKGAVKMAQDSQATTGTVDQDIPFA